MKSFRDLEIYKVSKRLAIEVHGMTLELPKFEMYEEGGQVRPFVKISPSMMVEGFGRRRYKAEYVNRYPATGNREHDFKSRIITKK